MKIITYIYIQFRSVLVVSCLALLSLILLACDEESFLDIYPLTQVTEGNFYNNAQELQQGVDDAYRQLGRLANAQNVACIFGELYSDNTHIAFQLGGNLVDDPISRHEILTTNGRIQTAWENTYNSIFLCNNMLHQLDITEVEISNEQKNNWISQLLVVRAYAYFNLVRAFGAVPLVKTRISPVAAYDYLREEPSVIYDMLMEDLTFAKNHLPEVYTGQDVGRITSFGASALLAKVHLTLGNNAMAETELKRIIDSGRYSLDANGDGNINIDDFNHLFHPDTKNSKSSLFEAQYMAGPNAFNSNHQFAYSPYQHSFNLPGIPTPFRGGGVNTPTDELIEEFEEGDPRMEVSIRTGFINQANGDFLYYPHTLKFYDPNFQNTGQNFEIIRYADILLMYTEVTGDPQYLNLVRERAGMPAFGSPGYPTELYPTLDLAIEHERRVELCFEMHRMFDLLRTNRAYEVMRDKVPGIREDRLFFPIPQYSIDVNPRLVQNPGY